MLFNKNKSIKIKLVNSDYAPDSFDKQLPIECELIRMIPGKDRPDYWIAKSNKTLTYEKYKINYLIVATRFVGWKIKKEMKATLLGVAYVLDESVIYDDILDFDKCKYIAISTGIEI